MVPPGIAALVGLALSLGASSLPSTVRTSASAVATPGCGLGVASGDVADDYESGEEVVLLQTDLHMSTREAAVQPPEQVAPSTAQDGPVLVETVTEVTELTGASQRARKRLSAIQLRDRASLGAAQTAMMAGYIELVRRYVVGDSGAIIFAVVWLVILSVALMYIVLYSASASMSSSSSSAPSRRQAPRGTPGKPDVRQSATEQLVGHFQAAPAPPPICPTLIIPNAAGLLNIPLLKLDNPGSGVIDIVGLSNRLLFRAVVAMESNRSSIQMSSAGSEEARCVVALEHGGSLGGAPKMQVLGKDGEVYGSLVGASDGSFRLTSEALNGQEVLKFSPKPSDRMAMKATTMDDKVLASAERKRDVWKVTVEKGQDAVLICSCMLGMVLLIPPTPSSRPESSATPGRRSCQ